MSFLFSSLFRSKPRWQTSDAHRLLLSKFLRPQPLSYAANDPNWRAALREPPAKALRSFLQDGLIAQAGVAVRMDHAYRVPELKELLRDRHLRSSGRKADLVERLIEADPQGMAMLTADVTVYLCTDGGRQVAEPYVERQRAEREGMEAEVLGALRRHDLRAACACVVRYERTQVFGRGLGIDWSRAPLDFNLDLVAMIFRAKPLMLASVHDSDMADLRIGAAMCALLGTGRPGKWLADDLTLNLRFDEETAARMLLFYASHQRQLQDYARSGVVKGVRVLCAGDESCPACRKLSGRTFPLNKAPELPNPSCTHPMGCRCTYIPDVVGIHRPVGRRSGR